MLFAFTGGVGHAEPLVPVAGAARAAGHTVAFAGSPAVAAELAARGFAVLPDPAATAEEPREITPLLRLSAEREDRVLREVFAGSLARRRAASVLAACEEWQPDGPEYAVSLLERLAHANDSA